MIIEQQRSSTKSITSPGIKGSTGILNKSSQLNLLKTQKIPPG